MTTTNSAVTGEATATGSEPDRPTWPPAGDRPARPPLDRPAPPGDDRIGPNRADRRYSAGRHPVPGAAAGPCRLRGAAARVTAGLQAYWRTGSVGRRNGDEPRRDPTVTRDELRLAVRAVLVHTPQHWPGGVYCSNDRSPFPCRMRHWGEHVLLAAGWDEKSIAAMARQADTGVPPWLAGASEAIPPAS
jgi:hypothetical protein